MARQRIETYMSLSSAIADKLMESGVREDICQLVFDRLCDTLQKEQEPVLLDMWRAIDPDWSN